MTRSYLSFKNHKGAGVKGGLLLLSAMLVIATTACTKSQAPDSERDLTKYVDPYIGTDYHGHVFIGANVPFGAVQPGPTNYVKGWDWCSGYHYSDSIMTGFSQLHLSGTGIGDLGDVLITPYTGERHFSPGNQENPLSGYASMYTHDRETPEAGYYGVDLLDYDIKAEMTATERVALHRYTFPESEEARIAINLQMGIGWDSPVETKLEKVNDTTFVGLRHSTGWAEDQRLFFAIVTSRSFDDVAIKSGDDISETSAEGRAVVGVLTGSTKADEQVQLKVGISPVSHENALQNIEKELPHWDFAQVREEARKKWNRELSKIRVSHSDESVKRTFYTSMYHSFIAPVLFNDHDGSYRGTDKEVYDNPGFENYSIFSLWDTYRAIHPLFTIVQTERVNDMVNSMLTIYEQQGKLPIWHLMGNETNTMVGYSAVPVVTDAVFKGFDGFDHDLAWEAVLESSNVDSDGIDLLKEMVYIPADKEDESVSKALEYAISDWAIARFAERRGDEENAQKYHERSRVYEKYFDSETRFMRPLLSDGSFKEPFDPFQSIHEEGDYTEGNAWQYTW
ncbi:MAG: GH92 family glycosyl hydrolase, partial [Marinilabilia sp.]